MIDGGYGMKREKKCLGSLLSIVLIMIYLLVLVPATVVYSKEKQMNVLFISSYTQSFMTVPDQITGLEQKFKDKPIRLDMEFMDTKRFESPENVNHFYQSLKYKLANSLPYDVIIVGDDAALQFAMDYQLELFSNTPIIFFGINDRERAKKASLNPYMTGIIEETSLKDNISLAKKLNPKASKVVAIVDNTLTGQGDQKQFETAMASFGNMESQILNVSDDTFEHFKEVLEGIDKNAILLFLSMNQDKSNKYMEMEEQYQFLKEHTKIPVYRASIGGVGQGLLGGKMISHEAFGELAAEMALKVMNGTPIESIPMIEETPYYYFFDYNIIKKYNINEKLLPKTSILLNKKANPFKQYTKYIITGLFVVTLLSLVAILLVLDNVKRRKIQKALQENNEELSMIYEELAASEEELKMQYNVVEQHAKDSNLMNQKYEIAIESTGSAVWELDVETNELEISNSIRKIIDKPIPIRGNFNSMLGHVVHPDYQEEVASEIQSYLEGKKEEIYIEVSDNAINDRRRWFIIRGKGIHDKENNLKKIHGIVLNTTIIKEKEAYIEYAANHDYLTQLPNRMKFMKTLEEELKKNATGALLLFDLDDFKSINDTRGHKYGDELLIEIAQRLNKIQDGCMFVARMGGDEFLVLVRGVRDHCEVEQYIHKIKVAFAEVFSIGGVEDSINFSMGITFYPTDGDNISQLFMNADTAMYKAKKNGKNSCVYYQIAMKEEIESKKKIEEILRNALKEDGFCLYYQPQVEVATGEIIGFEALLRLKNADISPAIFIPVAEETGFILEIGRWVAKEAIRQMAEWIKMGYPKKIMAINYSGKQMRDKGYINYIKRLVKIYKVEPRYVEIEITEGILFENNTQTMHFIQELKEFGFKIALDDFGTGYSSLNYLTYIPVDKIKFDKSMIDKFLEFENDKAMKSLISLAHSLNLKITAEGIEDFQKCIKLKENGCDYIQGYLFSKPLVNDEIVKIYNANFAMHMKEEVNQ